VAIAAMGFTLAQMYRHRELVAVLASGVSLHRLALPFIAAVFAVSMVQLLNQELILYRVAPFLLRDHGDIGKRSVRQFPVRFTDDGRGRLMQAALFDPATDTLTAPAILERDAEGRAFRRIEAEEAVWDGERQGWALHGGFALALEAAGGGGGTPGATAREPVEFFATDLDPDSLMVRRYGEYAAMLRLSQIEEMLDSGRVVDRPALLRHRYARFATVGVNVLVLLIALPSFLLREPASLLRQSLTCAAMTLPGMIGSAVGMMVEIPGVGAAVSVFLPVIVLIPIAAARWTVVKT
jgi:lipopolysaccharide export LptBFGC system permease protein LptF